MKKFTKIIVCLLVAALALCACGVEDETISYENLEITIPGNMQKQTGADAANYNFAYASNTMALMALYEDLAGTWLEGGSAEEYAQAVIDNNGIESTPNTSGKYVTFTYEANADGTDFTYLAGIFQDGTGYWMIQVACESSKYDNMSNKMNAILDSVVIN